MIAFDAAIDELKKVSNPTEKICHSSAYWATLQLLYVELIRNKDLTALSDLPKDQKERYWNQVRDMDTYQTKKIWLAQAIYCYDFLKNEP